MADKHLKTPENIPGKYYVDNTCIDCGMCPSIAPHLFQRFDEGGYSHVIKQPEAPEELALAAEALDSCPSESIGNDG
jgi:ferredoxin